VNFRSPGGDKHVSLDPVPANGFPAKRLRLQWDLTGVPESSPILVDGKPWNGGAIPNARARVALDLGGGVRLWLQHRQAAFAGYAGRLSISRTGGTLSVALDLLEKPGTVLWTEVKQAYIALAMAMGWGRGDLQAFDRACSRMPIHADVSAGKATLGWKTSAGDLGLEGSVAVAAVAEQDRAFRDRLDGNLIPIVKLSYDKLV
jgi:hypothetical protein